MSMNSCDSQGGDAQIGPLQPANLVNLSGWAYFFEQKKPVGTSLGRSPVVETRRDLSSKRGEELIGGQLSVKNSELSGPPFPFDERGSHFEDVPLGVSRMGGVKSLAEKAKRASGPEKKT